MKTKTVIVLLALAAAVLAGMHLRMPYNTQSWRMEVSAAGARSGERMNVPLPSGTIDVNRSTAAQLEALYGVGPSLAQEIVAEREKNGDFHYPEDLLNVKGIGETTLMEMRKQLKLP